MKQFYQKTLLFLLFAMVMQTASAYDCIVDGIYYNLNKNDHTASVTYYGSRNVFSPGLVYDNSDAYLGALFIPNSFNYDGTTFSVTSIGNSAFYNCSGLTSITIPSNVTTIGDYAFYSCSGLKNITISSNVTTIGDYAFYDCSGLTSITIPSNVTTIGDYAFYSCRGLKNITISSNVTTIGDYAFYDCSGLTSITIPSNVTTIGDYAFYSCSGLISINFPNIVTIGSGAFSRCTSLETAKIGNNCYEIPAYLFSGCDNLKKVDIGDENALDGCGKIDMSAFPDKIGLEVYIYGKYVHTVNERDYVDGHSVYGSDCAHDYTSFYVPFQSRTMFSMWKAYENQIYDIQTNKLLGRPHIKVSTTQTTMNIWIWPIYDFLDYKFDGKPLEEADIYYTGQRTGTEFIETQIRYTGLIPDTEYRHSLTVMFLQDYYNDRDKIDFYETVSLRPDIHAEKHSSSLHLTTSYRKGDAIITGTKFIVGNKEIPEIESKDWNYDVYYSGLDPQQKFTALYSITVSHGINNELSYTFTKQEEFTTPNLILTTLSPRVTNKGEAVVSATTNLDEAETHAGFEWRKIDAPDLVESKQGEAVIYNGTMEGKIKNLDPSTYWKVRAYYRSNSGNMYYGDWVGFDPSDFSCFEPTVHTYGSPTVDGNSATLTGMVVEGTDEILEQGFEYWKNSTSARELKRASSDVQRVTADKGQRMTVTLAGLSPSTTYSYQAYVTTAKGTFYGEELSFDIPSDGSAPSAISVPQLSPIASSNVYTLQGMKIRSGTTSVSDLPRGVYIVNGRKVVVR